MCSSIVRRGPHPEFKMVAGGGAGAVGGTEDCEGELRLVSAQSRPSTVVLSQGGAPARVVSKWRMVTIFCTFVLSSI